MIFVSLIILIHAIWLRGQWSFRNRAREGHVKMCTLSLNVPTKKVGCLWVPVKCKSVEQCT